MTEIFFEIWSRIKRYWLVMAFGGLLALPFIYKFVLSPEAQAARAEARRLEAAYAIPTDPVGRIEYGCRQEFAHNESAIDRCIMRLLLEKTREIEQAKLDRARRY
jgi:hypothetical protein